MPNEKDDFWDISSLIPPKKKQTAPVFSEQTDTAYVILHDGEKDKREAERKISFLGAKQEVFLNEYAPAWNPLLKSVRVHAYESNYRIFHVFKTDAEFYAKKKGREVPFVPFFSYVPQYTQMNGSQINYYLYFRDQANEGCYLKTTQAYLMLYFYEIINLPEYIDPQIGILRMANAWMAYRKAFPAIDKYLIAWLSDYALIHGLPCPNELLSDALPDILSVSHMKEFYLGMGNEFSLCLLDAVLSLASAYDFKNGRYSKGEHGNLFITHVRAAAKLVLEAVLKEKTCTATHQTVEKSYEAYVAALCAGEYKYRIEVSYCSISGTESLKTIMTAAVKYAENKVRAYLSIKSRLSVVGLPQTYKEMIDAYFARHLVRVTQKEAESRPEYEVLYDAPSIGFSEDEAHKIESASWANTIRLIPEEEREELLISEKEAPQTDASVGGDAISLSPREMLFLQILCDDGSESAKQYALKNGFLPEILCEHINEYFIDRMGDIVIETSEEGIFLLEDYETEVNAFIEAYLGK